MTKNVICDNCGETYEELFSNAPDDVENFCGPDCEQEYYDEHHSPEGVSNSPDEGDEDIQFYVNEFYGGMLFDLD